jgi:ferritin-like metal-binding protein YciE
MKQETLNTLFIEQIRDIYDAEKQLVKALPKVIKAVETEDLAEALRSHLVETQGHVSRIEEVFGIVGMAPKAKPCNAMKGLLKEGDETIQEQERGTLRDLGIIAACQRVEHYEVSAYGTARALAEHLGMSNVSDLLQETESEEAKADETLTGIALSLYQTFNEAGKEEVDSDELEPVGASKSSHSGQMKKQVDKGARSA